MKKRGGSLETTNIAFYVVLAIAVFNIVAFVTAHDWNSLIFFSLAAFVATIFKVSPLLTLVIAIISANVFRASKFLQEGLENKKKPKSKKHTKVTKSTETPLPHKEASSTADNAAYAPMNANTLEGLTSTANGLMERQDKLHELAGQLGPLMKQASSMLKQLPEGFLQNAFKNKK
uniref:Uncharacterized protein n=1 Tax=viral metagenome TaxID=1070528 RepID=A0A6C0BAE0_9ZZZZ